MDYDVIVIGGGHAGIEAAMAASRMGVSTVMITQSLDAIGRLSCNPSVGGVAKGNIVREIDALGGVMGLLIDNSMIQFRVLNRSRGPAVQAYRSQADKTLYSSLAKQMLEKQNHLDLFQDTVVDFILSKEKNRIIGVVTERGHKISAKAVVLTTGTFMEGKIFIGEYETSSGRLGEPAAIGLGTSLRRMDFTVRRLKTGTPARVHRDSLDFSKMQPQNGDRFSGIVGSAYQGGFSFSTEYVDRPDVPCWLTYTTEITHKIIRENIGRSPLYGGKIQGIGPRYCPSLEDKVMRFPQRNRHHVFVEPEGLSTDEMYLNGMSSSLPEDVQFDFIHSVPGLENAQIMRPGYAVEYDFIDPRQLSSSLECKKIAGLFSAGQTNGTSGYEEAGGQGLLAGLNAALSVLKISPVVLKRDEAYLGVLVDDLVTLGTKEPYRMFTARAEYRLRLRHDTADERLMPKAAEVGAIPQEKIEELRERLRLRDEIIQLLETRKVTSHDVQVFADEAKNQNKRDERLEADSEKDEIEKSEPSVLELFTKIKPEQMKGKTFAHVLSLPGITEDMLVKAEPSFLSAQNNKGIPVPAYRMKIVFERAWLDVKYRHYIQTQEKSVQRFKKMENTPIPQDFDYDEVTALSAESRGKLKEVKPQTLGQASRISGIRASDIMLLMIKLR